MGFSLQAFFDELSSIIYSDQHNIMAKYDDLVQAIVAGHKYAQECGQIAKATTGGQHG